MKQTSQHFQLVGDLDPCFEQDRVNIFYLKMVVDDQLLSAFNFTSILTMSE